MSASRLRRLFRQDDSRAFCALQPLDLDVERGASVGIVGRNGSGKSTLLKMIAGVLKPTSGTVEVHGRISALLELGSGFNPDFTGRENVHYNASMLGLSNAEIDARFEDIVRFSEIGDFLEQPVRTYSSGMTIRLAFAVAINVNPEILIVDEALAVGDVFFQQKCFERVRELRELGTTLLFVSHDIGAIYKHCSRAILLDHGHVKLDATPREVADLYQAQMILDRDERPETIEIKEVTFQELTPTATQYVDRIISSPNIELVEFVILSHNGNPVDLIVSGEHVTIRILLRFLDSAIDPHVGFKIRDRMGSVLFETNTFCMKRGIGSVQCGQSIEVAFGCKLPIAEGNYSFTLGVADGGYAECLFRHQLIFAHNVASLKVLRDNEDILWDGVVNLSPSCVIRRQPEGSVDMNDPYEESDGREAYLLRTDLSVLSIESRLPQLRVEAESIFSVLIDINNSSRRDVLRPTTLYLSYHWLDSFTHSVVVYEGTRTTLPLLLPVGSNEVEMGVQAPAKAGDYVLRATFVQEGVTWFDEIPIPIFSDTFVSVHRSRSTLTQDQVPA